jgi:hypothetical protein
VTLGGARRSIPWDQLGEVELDPKDAHAVGDRWRARQAQEHLAVGAFSQLTWEVAAHGGDPLVLAMLTRAASDEVRHAEICRRAAVAFLGEAAVPARFSGVPRPPAHDGASGRDRTVLHVVEMCCLSETFTGVYFTEAIAMTEHAPMRVLLESLLEDEIDHGRVGWAYLASVPKPELGALSKALPDMLERTVGRTLRGAAHDAEPDVPARARLGHIASAPCVELFRTTLREVILPGFDVLGVDLGPANARARAEGWA